MPFKKWLEHHKLSLILPLFYETQTSQGYGYIEEVPTYYGASSPTQICCWEPNDSRINYFLLLKKTYRQTSSHRPLCKFVQTACHVCRSLSYMHALS